MKKRLMVAALAVRLGMSAPSANRGRVVTSRRDRRSNREMKMKTGLLAFGLSVALSAPAFAQLKPYQDYTVSDAVSNVTTVKVKENMVEDYLQGIRTSWVSSSEAEKRLGHIKDYKVYVSDLANSGEFNVILVTTFARTSDLAPNKARYEAFMRAWGTQNEAANRTTTTTVYPNLRHITGEYLMREVTFMPARR